MAAHFLDGREDNSLSRLVEQIGRAFHLGSRGLFSGRIEWQKWRPELMVVRIN
jgi:hypothetical protein